MKDSFRLSDKGRIDRGRPVSFSFDGRRMTAYAGDTLASALLANGVHLVGRSFKYHRPRGVLGAGVEEPNALVTIDRGPGRVQPNVQATTVEVHEGLVARSQNRWPSLRWDIGAINDAASALIPAGFYYKTFMWPRSAWKTVYEPAIRRSAGLGPPPTDADPDSYALQYDHCEVLVVGAGPAGLAAALAASTGRARVILCDERSELGGSLLADPDAVIDGMDAWTWLERTTAELSARPNVTILTRTTAFRYGSHNMISLAERVSDHVADAAPGSLRERWRQVRAGRVILATGAHERPIVFKGNDRPGVMLASAARAYLNRYGVRLGRAGVVLTRDDSGYQTAFDLARAGIATTIADLRTALPALLAGEAAKLGIEVIRGAKPLKTTGRLRVTSVEIALPGGRRRTFRCDLVLMAGGWTPTVHLFSQTRGALRWDERLEAYIPGESSEALTCVGACQGDFPTSAALQNGFAAGASAVGVEPGRAPLCARADGAIDMRQTPMSVAADSAMAFIDFQNDVTSKDLRLAVREGFLSVEHFKRYTTTGMATDQGRTSNVNAMAVVGEAMGVPMGQVGITTFRPPYTPVTFGTLAGNNRGEGFLPARLTPTHEWAVARSAVFEDVGLWKRARYFPQDGESMEAAVRRECRITRAAAGILDASTLGKIEVVGPDAAEFMNRMYVNAWTKLKPGGCRYGVLLRDDGFIFDDGVVGRLAEDRFHVTTTTGGAAGVFNLMEDYLQTEWPDLDVWLTSTTEQWAVVAVQGPRARDILAPLVEGIDLSVEAFPHMAVREGRIAGVPTRLFRVSFTGELGFEVNVPSSRGLEVWEAIWAQGHKYGATVYGTETLHVLRAEKGFIIVGQETDGTVTPDDVGLTWAIGKAKRDFVGKRSLTLAGPASPDRKQLVGLLPSGHSTVPDEGAQLVRDSALTPFSAQGHVTSAYWSEALGGPIALGLLKNGRARHGELVRATSLDGAPTLWRVCEPVFLDPKGERLNA
ncbi:sarcosine oxidase subunit alpha family protein [Rhizorhabdus dicambivorans]|uniref:Sarcosine oxidase subunit alpha family protein n=1 Tax=Rhizorhabdus dicambivorans TaxID=1850238 RepID=A0A2A4FYJ5_9SPHN|nr:sarcosine oxidase subunit alpha family protein [Rhizorhabdus dicambivorans]ATE64220.1 sarcosine oxidase subunit alpha family protein [Rhizorhabdus dicambivorans]PCE42507.1 sarcosine oxidase subunit alpha family protein [Rhizorhabdus dicambivorans]